tara:strand:- start:346 stop:1026 length:681 start_codon:yes stop_codon:yes gene_type:complete
MKNILFFFIFIIFTTSANGHIADYLNLKKIYMEIFKDGKNIGFCEYKFIQKDSFLEVQNITKFNVDLLGLKIFTIDSHGTEVYKNNKLISFKSETYQNKKKKFVNLNFKKKTNNFFIEGSSFVGFASLNNVVGNWWNHDLLKTDSQISPLSGSVKKQVVSFIQKEKIKLYGKEYNTHKFKLKSLDVNLPKDKKLDFDIWINPKNNLILKVSYNRMGTWEYRLKTFN